MAYFKSNPSPDDVMRRTDLWGLDLTTIPGFAACVADGLAQDA